jgi:hypothetical protein
VFHRSKALRRCAAVGVHLVGQLLHQHFQLFELGIAGCKEQEEERLASRAGLDQRFDLELYHRWFPAAVCADPPT